MANKMFVVIFAFLAIQGWASVEALSIGLENIPDELPFELMKNILNMLPETSNEVFAVKTKGDPNKCVPYIQDGYNAATEVKRIITEGTAFYKKFSKALEKCVGLPTQPEMQKCGKKATQVFLKEVEPLKQAWKIVHPKIVDLYNKFTKCLS